MKLILISITAFLIFAAPVLGALDVKDIEKIDSIVKASEDRLTEQANASEKRLTEQANASEKRLTQMVKESEDRFIEMVNASEKRLMEYIDTKFSEMDKRFNIVFTFVIALISLIVIVVGIPQIIMAWRGREERTQKQEIQELRQEIEMLKQRQIVSP